MGDSLVTVKKQDSNEDNIDVPHVSARYAGGKVWSRNRDSDSIKAGVVEVEWKW